MMSRHKKLFPTILLNGSTFRWEFNGKVLGELNVEINFQQQLFF